MYNGHMRPANEQEKDKKNFSNQSTATFLRI